MFLTCICLNFNTMRLQGESLKFIKHRSYAFIRCLCCHLRQHCGIRDISDIPVKCDLRPIATSTSKFKDFMVFVRVMCESTRHTSFTSLRLSALLSATHE